MGVKIDGKFIGEFKIGCFEWGFVGIVCESVFNFGVIFFLVSLK